jgi:hypothetical protein
MKVILSRKGFDSKAGGCASPIFEDGSFLSLPIPEEQFSHVSFSDIGDGRLGTIVEDLTHRWKEPVKASDRVHLDPDLKGVSLRRERNWRALFGQAAAAQRHLDLQGVGPGDIFLFFGWFRRVERYNGRFRFSRGAPDVHMLFGWLRVGEIWRLSQCPQLPGWARDHPHVSANWPRNTIYVAAQNDTGYAAGTFRSAADELILTRKGQSRSVWCLPRWFHPSRRKSILSYHSNLALWEQDKNYAYLRSVGRGQEFVLDTTDYPEAVGWVEDLITKNAA